MSVRSFREVNVAIKGSEVDKATASASTLADLISTIPRAYQALLGDQLTKKFRVAHKHANVQSTISLYERHLNEKSFPPVIRNALKEPKLQFAKEFLATNPGSETPSSFAAKVLQARTEVLKSAIAYKKQELAHLATLILPDQSTWIQAVKNVGMSVASSVGGALGTDDRGQPILSQVPSTAQTEFVTMAQACQVYTYRVLALARASIDRAEIQKLAKIQVKDQTDVEMTDASKEPAVRDIIREELVKALAKASPRPNGKPKKSANRVQKRTAPGKKAKAGGKQNKKGKGRKSR